MVKREKKTKISGHNKKKTERPDVSTDNLKVIWAFDNIDRSGIFRFDVDKDDFLHKEVLSKIISYSNMTWTEIKRQTHDNGKSKHHYLDFAGLSKEAQERYRIKFPNLENTDALFSFAFQNKLRVIGIRDGQIFHVIWYDSEHKFYPSKKH